MLWWRHLKEKKVAEEAGVNNFINSLPEKFKTIVGEGGIKLSGGQRQRIAIARALILNPKILIFDDCLSSVDSKTEKIILKSLSSQITRLKKKMEN